MALTHLNRPAQESDELLAIENRLQTQLTSKANKAQEAWITPTLLNGWVVANNMEVQYFKDEFGIVHVRGCVTGGALNSQIFVLPSTYKPIQNVGFVVSANAAFARGIIDTNGIVMLYTGATTNVYLDNIHFKA